MSEFASSIFSLDKLEEIINPAYSSVIDFLNSLKVTESLSDTPKDLQIKLYSTSQSWQIHVTKCNYTFYLFCNKKVNDLLITSFSNVNNMKINEKIECFSVLNLDIILDYLESNYDLKLDFEDSRAIYGPISNSIQCRLSFHTIPTAEQLMSIYNDIV